MRALVPSVLNPTHHKESKSYQDLSHRLLLERCLRLISIQLICPIQTRCTLVQLRDKKDVSLTQSCLDLFGNPE